MLCKREGSSYKHILGVCAEEDESYFKPTEDLGPGTYAVFISLKLTATTHDCFTFSILSMKPVHITDKQFSDSEIQTFLEESIIDYANTKCKEDTNKYDKEPDVT